MRWIKLFAVIALIVGVERFCHKQTGGFSLYKVTTHCSSDPIWTVPPQPFEKEAGKLLDQPFTYLGEGNQCVAFLSQDTQVVLKLFKLHLVRTGFIREALRSKEQLSFTQKLKKARLDRLSNTMQSLLFSYQNFRDETGLIYLHLSPSTHLKKKLTLYDKIGICQSIDLDQTLFFLQRKAEPVYETLSRLMQDKEVEKAKQCIYSLLELIHKRQKMGIADIDPRIDTNFGFVGCQAIEIDVGSFLSKAPDAFQSQLQAEITHFKQWLQKHYPPLAVCLDENHL
jgi:hypothetical protein